MNNEIFTKIITLLKKRGFVQLIKQDLPTLTYSYGPAGTLLRRNIAQCWWEWMITSQENTFPVESTDSKDSTWDHFLEISKQLEWSLPFSITQSRSYVHTPADRHTDKFLFNSCKKTSLVMQNFCQATAVTQSLDSAIRSRLKWWKQFSGNPAKFSVTDIEKTETGYHAHIQYCFPWGLDDVETVTSLGDTPLQPYRETLLSQHQFVNGKKKSLPSVVECNAILEQGFLAFLLDAYPGYQGSPNNGTKESSCLQLHPRLTPYKIAVCYQGNNCGVLQQLAANIGKDLRQAGIVTINHMSNSSLDKKIAQNDEMGIPYMAVVQDSVLEAGVVEVRSRDTTIKEQVHISQLADFVQKRVAGSS